MAVQRPYGPTAVMHVASLACGTLLRILLDIPAAGGFPGWESGGNAGTPGACNPMGPLVSRSWDWLRALLLSPAAVDLRGWVSLRGGGPVRWRMSHGTPHLHPLGAPSTDTPSCDNQILSPDNAAVSWEQSRPSPSHPSVLSGG